MTELATKRTLEPKDTFRRQLSDMFDEMWESIGRHHMGFSGRALQGVEPSADLAATTDMMTLTLDLPGMDENDVEITIGDGRLTVTGEKKTEHEEMKADYLFRERTYGKFERSFTLPADVDEAAIEARFTKGVLTVIVPRTGNLPGGVRKIEIAKS